MSDIPITITGPAPAPVAYTLSPLEQWTPSSAVATFDGTGAAGDFLPCCSIYSQTGALLGRMFPGTLHPGDVAEVTYSPFSRSQTVTASGKAAEFFDNPAGEAMGGPGSGHLQWVKAAGSDLMDVSAPANPTVIVGGTYAFTVELQQIDSPNPLVTGVAYGATLAVIDPFTPVGWQQRAFWSNAGGGNNSLTVGATMTVTAGSTVFVDAWNDQLVSCLFRLKVYVQLL